MITVYGGGPTRSFRVVWALEELGLPYRLKTVDLRRRHEDEAFMRLNPSGFLPVLEDEGGVVMVESVAMLEYLIARHDGGRLAPAPQDPAFPLYQQFLHLGEAGMAAYLNVVVATRFYAPEAERRNWGVQVAERMFLNRLELVATRLESAPMLAGDTFTAADISVVYALDIGDRLGLAEHYPAQVADYRKRIAERAGYKAATGEAVQPRG